jgi:hypothetical protein
MQQQFPPVVGITTLNGLVAFIPTSCFRISAIATSDTFGETELIQSLMMPHMWLPIGILCGA